MLGPGLKRICLVCFALLATSASAGSAAPDAASTSVPEASAAVPGVGNRQLDADFWISRLHHPQRVLLDAGSIRARNARMLRQDPSMHDLGALPDVLARAQVEAWIDGLASRPRSTLFDTSGSPISSETIDHILANRALDAIPAQQPARFGLVVRRASLRSFPTDLRVFSAPGDTDLDRFQESALFPGTPVAIVHSSRDGRWNFVVSPRYAAWVDRDAIAEGTRQQVLSYPALSPARVVTGAVVRSAFVPDTPAVSTQPLDMGVRLPLAPAQGVVHGQNAYTSWSVLLPTRSADGSLLLLPALLPRTADTAAGDLPLTDANLLRQAFKFLGERYGWGHDYGARDCSGFVSEVYRSMGVLLPRNTSDQARSPVLARTHFDDGAVQARAAAVRGLQVGDLVYIPGHVMLVIGSIDGMPYVIHDIHNGKVRDADGTLRSLHLNAVSVTPLLPLRFDDGSRFVDRITDIVEIGQAEHP